MINDDPRLNALVKQGKDGDIVIVGVPFDYTRKRTICKGGQDNGPCCLRRFIPKVGPLVNPEYGVDIQMVKVTDYGNVEFKDKEIIMTPEKIISKVSEEILSLLNNHQLPFLFGGAKEGAYGAELAFKQAFEQSNYVLIAGKPTLKRPYDGDKLTSDNLMTLLTSHPNHNLTVFGTSLRYYPQTFNHNFEIVSFQDIRREKVFQSEYVNTQAGSKFRDLLLRLQGRHVHVSLSVQAIDRFRGCRDTLAVGLSEEEILQIFFLMGMTKEVLLVDIAEFNPSVQDYESSLLIVNLLYYFIMGWTKRQK